MIELTQPRKRSGQFRKSGWHNFKKRKRVWREYAMHPITVSVFGLVAYVGIHTAYAMNEIQRLDGRVEIIREPTDQSSLRGTAIGKESTGELAQANSDSIPRESSEGGKDINIPVPSSEVEEKILKAWEGTGEGHIAVAVAKSESGLRTDAVGDIHLEYWHEGKKIGHSCGIFQIRVLPGRPDCETLKDVDKNIEFARKLYDRAGFIPWSMFKNNAYLKHI